MNNKAFTTGEYVGFFVILVFLAVPTFLILHGIGRQNWKQDCSDSPLKIGEMVAVKTTGQQGQIVDIKKLGSLGEGVRGWRYEIRLPVIEQTTKTRILSDDEPIRIAGYSLIWMGDYEIEKWED